MATMAQEVTQDYQEREELLASEAPRASLGKMERKEAQCSFQVLLKVFRETEGSQDPLAYRGREVQEDQLALWATQERQGSQDLLATLAAQA